MILEIDVVTQSLKAAMVAEHPVARRTGARPVYDDAYGAYRRLFDSLRPMFDNPPGQTAS